MSVGKCPKGYVAINYDEQVWHACAKESILVLDVNCFSTIN
jgi:hypothetical protein